MPRQLCNSFPYCSFTCKAVFKHSELKMMGFSHSHFPACNFLFSHHLNLPLQPCMDGFQAVQLQAHSFFATTYPGPIQKCRCAFSVSCLANCQSNRKEGTWSPFQDFYQTASFLRLPVHHQLDILCSTFTWLRTSIHSILQILPQSSLLPLPFLWRFISTKT